MKRQITLLFFAFFFSGLHLNAQQPSKCSTDEQYKKITLLHPSWKEQWKKIEAVAEQYRFDGSNNFSVQQIITIPIVIHVIYNNSSQNISNAQIQSQIDVLNEDFRRLNSDTNITRNIFKPVAGDAMIQFCLAQRDPAGNLTDGIIRTYTTQSSWGCDDSMKFSAYGGQDGWPGDQYLNIWVCNLNCANGYAYYPGTPDPYDGVVVHYYVFGRVGNVAPGHNGRTGTHEVGHYLGLYHTFDYGTCAGISPNNCVSSGDKMCDTPSSDYPGYGCDTMLNNCTEIPVDFPNQIENYMDYADDMCRNMFSLDQINRMRAMLLSFRNILLISPGCISPLTSYYDAALLEIAKPFAEMCSSSLAPLIKIGNISSSALNALEIYYRIDGGAYSLYNWNGAIATGYSAWATLPVISVTAGAHIFDCYLDNPNGFTDQNAANDTANISFDNLISGNGVLIPFNEGFENGIFPPPGWFLSNPDYDRIWEPNSSAGGYGASTACAYFRNFYNGSTGTHDGLITPKLDFTVTGNTSVMFDVAYAAPNSPFYADTLKLFYSLDCGETWIQVYVKGGNQLSTAPAPVTFSEFTPDSSEWRTETVPVAAATGNPLVTFKFENVSRWGNNLYLDNINIPVTIGINEPPSQNNFSVFPNPAKEKFMIHTIPALTGKRVFISDVYGNEIYSSQISTPDFEFKTLNWKSGVYFLKIENTIKKVVVIK